MSRHPFHARAASLVLVLMLGVWHVSATVPADRSETSEFSPLFERRLEVSLESMDAPPERDLLAYTERLHRDVMSPISGNPLSVCVGSACIVSVCFGSACLNSRCLGSTCIVSGCGGSACVTSGCAGSACIASACAGSVCVGSTCLGSACLQCPGDTGGGVVKG